MICIRSLNPGKLSNYGVRHHEETETRLASLADAARNFLEA